MLAPSPDLLVSYGIGTSAWRNRRFRLTVVLMLALGVGVTTAMFSVVNGLLLRSLALRDPGKLMLIGERVPQIAGNGGLAWYALVARSVAQRQNELAIRTTLGASERASWSTVMRQALSPVLAGLAAGLATAAIAAPLLRSLLFQVNPANPAVLATVAATVAIAAAAACLAPARRATQTDPLFALRTE